MGHRGSVPMLYESVEDSRAVPGQFYVIWSFSDVTRYHRLESEGLQIV